MTFYGLTIWHLNPEPVRPSRKFFVFGARGNLGSLYSRGCKGRALATGFRYVSNLFIGLYLGPLRLHPLGLGTLFEDPLREYGAKGVDTGTF